MSMEITISSREAEEILFALALRSKQKGLTPVLASNAHALGQYLDEVFAEHFGWDKSIDRTAHWRLPIKSVNIKTYELAPGQRYEYPQNREPRKERNQ